MGLCPFLLVGDGRCYDGFEVFGFSVFLSPDLSNKFDYLVRRLRAEYVVQCIAILLGKLISISSA